MPKVVFGKKEVALMDPLGLVRQDVPPEIVLKLAVIEKVDFSRVRARMVVDFPTPEEELDRHEREVKRFLALIALEGNRHVVSEKIDALWHYFVLHTQEYAQFCQEVFGSFVHHIPILPHEKESLAVAYQRTKETYAKYFGPPPQDLWADNQQICTGGCIEYAPDITTATPAKVH